MATLQPVFLRQGWSAVAAVTARTGLADFYASRPHALDNVLPPDAAGALPSQLAQLFTPCPAGSRPFERRRQPGAAPCVKYDSSVAGKQPIGMEEALGARCGGEAAARRVEPQPADLMDLLGQASAGSDSHFKIRDPYPRF